MIGTVVGLVDARVAQRHREGERDIGLISRGITYHGLRHLEAANLACVCKHDVVVLTRSERYVLHDLCPFAINLHRGGEVLVGILDNAIRDARGQLFCCQRFPIAQRELSNAIIELHVSVVAAQ